MSSLGKPVFSIPIRIICRCNPELGSQHSHANLRCYQRPQTACNPRSIVTAPDSCVLLDANSLEKSTLDMQRAPRKPIITFRQTKSRRLAMHSAGFRCLVSCGFSSARSPHFPPMTTTRRETRGNDSVLKNTWHEALAHAVTGYRTFLSY